MFTSDQTPNLNVLFHQAKGETAAALGLYQTAVRDFGRAIELTPQNPSLYLDRGKAHFDLGNYDQAIEDYHRFTTHVSKETPLISSDFHLGFAKGLGKGIYESGSQLILLASDFVRHPIATSKQMYEAISSLSKLAYDQQWGHLAEVLVPEVYKLTQEWDSLPPNRKGELAGLAFGKHGADILIPGSLAKMAAKGVKEIKGLSSICKGFNIAEKTLLLESAAEVGSGAHVAEVIQNSKKTLAIGEELGFTTRELAELKHAGKLEGTVAEATQHPAMWDSIMVHRQAKDVLKPYSKKFMLEEQVRDCIHKTGIPTFPRPTGIPDNYLVRISSKGVGMEYVHPTNSHISVRVMPGKPHSPFLHQQTPYVVQMKDGKAFNKYGKLVPHESPEAHIPIYEFIYRE